MVFVIFCLDKPGHEKVRLENYEAHKTYLSTAPYCTIMSGPLVTDDDKTMQGSFFLVESDEPKIVEQFVENDPFNRAGLWEFKWISAFRKRVG